MSSPRGIISGMTTKTAKDTFGTRLRAARLKAGLTLNQAALQAGTSFQALSRLEREDRATPLPLAARLAKAVGVPLGDLLPADLQ